MSQSFGATLKEARERKGVSLRQIATATKISVAALESIERNDFSRLPGGIFSRAFVRSYAIEVGLDPDATVQQFLRLVEEERHPADLDDAGAGHRPVAHPPLSRRDSTADFTPEFEFQSRQRIAAVALKLVAISVPVAAAILYLSSRSSTPSPESGMGRPVAEQETVAGPSAQPPPAPAPVADVQPASLAAARPSSEDNGVTIEIAPTGDCWAQLTIDGTVSVSRVLRSGEREARAFHDSAVLQVGDAAACAVLIDGRPARPLGPPRKVRQVRITRQNYPTFLR